MRAVTWQRTGVAVALGAARLIRAASAVAVEREREVDRRLDVAPVLTVEERRVVSRLENRILHVHHPLG